MTDEQSSILLVEDNPAHVRLTREALKRSKFTSVLSVAKDGVEAMEMVRREGIHSCERLPDLILLDLNLPRKDGRAVLAEIKGDHELRRIPVVVLTTSEAESDITAAYDLNANCCIVKPADLDAFFDAILGTESYWLKTVRRAAAC